MRYFVKKMLKVKKKIYSSDLSVATKTKKMKKKKDSLRRKFK